MLDTRLALAGDVQWGPVSAWAGAGGTILVALIALLAAFEVFNRFRTPHLRITFEQREPWCRSTGLHDPGPGFWVRVGVENRGKDVARGCVGRLTSLLTDGVPRPDVDPVQLRWAGMPRSKAFDAVDLRRGQREFLNVLFLKEQARWRIATFDDPDFDPGFSTALEPEHEHALTIAVFADNTNATARLVVEKAAGGGKAIVLRLATRPSQLHR